MMKKYFLVTFTLLNSLYIHAQFRVDSLGNASICATNDGSSKLYIRNYTETNGLNILSNCQNVSNGIKCSTSTKKTGNIYGINSFVSATNTSQIAAAIGGYIRGNGTTNGVLIGVLGRMGSTNSTHRVVGVYGSSTSSLNTNMVDTAYAGFFNGLTKVRGDLIVTGQMRGTLLTNSPSFSNMRSSSENELVGNMLLNKLKDMKAMSYMYDMPKSQQSSSNTKRIVENYASLDNLSEEEIERIEALSEETGEGDDELSAIERQIICKQHYGLSAEQLGEVLPDLVYENEDGTKSINYVELVPILVQAVGELSAKVEELENGNLQKKAQKATANQRSSEGSLLMLSLAQNKPNPFSNSTTIEVCIPEDVQKAFIYVYDLQGKKVEQVDITARGKQNIQLSSANLTDGMFLYSLIADGKVVETRRMIVEK